MSDHNILAIQVITIFVYSSSVYSCYPFLISSAFCRSMPFLPFIVPFFTWNVPFVSLIFLKRSLVFPTPLCPSIYLHWSSRKAILSLLAIHWNSSFIWIHLSFSHFPFTCLLFSAIFKASSDNHFSFLQSFFLGMVLIMASCMMLQTSIHSSSDTPLNLSV